MDAGSIRHDATSGFHDIKALGDSPFAQTSHLSFTTLLIVLAILLVLMLAISFSFRRKKKSKPPESAFTVFRNQLSELKHRYEGKVSSPRETASQCSEALRKLLEEVLRFPAQELTTREIGLRLEDLLFSRFFSEDSSEIRDFLYECRDLLRSLERGAYGTEQVVKEEGQKLLPYLEKGETLSRRLQQWIESPTPTSKEDAHAPL